MGWDLERLAGSYVTLAPGARLHAPDALSVAGLFARERRLAERRGPRSDPEETAAFRFRHDYYGRLWQALTRGLDLAHPREALAALTELSQFGPERGDPGGLRVLLGTRAQILAFAGLRPAPDGASAAGAWYAQERGRVLQGLQPVDRALCALLQWEVGPELAVEMLRQGFGLPALDPEQQGIWGPA